MEEDIKVLEEFINNYKLIQEKYKDDEIQAEIEKSCYFEEVPAQAIENLIKRNKDLEEMLKHRIKYTNELEKDLFENASNYVISKSKVREKIEEAKERIEDICNQEYVTADEDEEMYILETKIAGWEELLQEGDDK